ncbi:uncharacterized protein A1O9_04853 [Exophiala aquamarina CBS 119918]|uniref:Uncharacterized protein n=1 Tax=Exophiala aquamarina CBS 119918 TaxID=1182545 RepID=A0A072PIQ4_9EURO|nr:uncharacterized protein A1O9_04853 [Exophiala aquamarina CBS 119918]KEF60004.1 hypothetical protein A1O9_04853 [Exophiala aquamarina CBS 119918]
MSSSAYQTNAKPRGRRGSYSESSDKQSRSRASSSASMRLSKTLSRHLDEVAVPRNSRPSSPAVHNHRQRPLDLRSSDASVNTGCHTPDLRNRSKAHSMPQASSGEKDLAPPPMVVVPVRSSEPTTPGRSGVLGGAKLDAYARHQESMNTSPGLTRNTRSSKSLASMQPTVTEEAEERADETPLPTAQPSVSFPTVLPQTMPSKAHDMLPHDVPMPVSPVTSNPSPRILASSDPRASESSLDELLLAAPSPKAPIPFISQPVISRSEECAPVTIVQSPGPGLEYSQMYEQVPPPARTPLASPPQSPMLHQYMGSPPLQPVPYMHPFPYPPPLMPNATYSPSFYPAHFALGPIPNFQAEMIPSSSSVGPEDERTMLLEKVSNVLPDINRLLHHYQETQGLLSEKENLVKQAETHHVEEITKLRVELTVTKEEFEKIIGELATENVRLKAELSEQTERFSRVEENNPSLAEIRNELTELKSKYKKLEIEHGQAKFAVDQLKTEKDILKAEAEQYTRELQENRLQLEESCQRQIRENEEAHTRTSAEQKTNLSKIQLDLAGMITKHTIQKKDLDSVRSMLNEKEHALALKTKELETMLQTHKEELELRNHEDQEKDARHKQEIALWSQKMAEGVVRREEMINKMRASLESQIEKEKKSTELRIALLTAKFTDLEKKQTTSFESAKAENENLKNEITKERGAHDALKSLHSKEKEAHKALQSRHDAHHTQLTDAMLFLRNKQAEWHRESEKMDRILQSLGKLGSSKTNGKGDEYL